MSLSAANNRGSLSQYMFLNMWLKFVLSWIVSEDVEVAA